MTIQKVEKTFIKTISRWKSGDCDNYLFLEKDKKR